MARMLIATSVATFFLLSAPIWAQELETPEGTEEICEGTPVPCPDAPALQTVVDEAKRLVGDATKGKVVRSDNPRLVWIEGRLRLLLNPPKAPQPTRSQTRAHGSRPRPTTVPAPSSPKPVNGHLGTPGHGEVEHLILEVWGVCRQLRTLQRDDKVSSTQIAELRKQLDKAPAKFDKRLATETTKRQSDDATLAVLFLLLLGAGMFFVGITHNPHQGD